MVYYYWRQSINIQAVSRLVQVFCRCCRGVFGGTVIGIPSVQDSLSTYPGLSIVDLGDLLVLQICQAFVDRLF